jgi:hypothetical protein
MVFILASCLSIPGVAAEPLTIGLRKQLFVDDYVIAEMRGITREAGRAKKYGVVLKPSLPTDFQTGEVHDGPDGGAGYEFGESAFCWFISPHWDAGKKMFRLWYMASKRPGSGLAYAESKDGMIWTKPLVSRNGKSNLVIVNPGGGLDGINVSIDSSLPLGHAEKYKAAYFSYGGEGNHGTMTRLDYSADGITWKSYNNGKPVTGRAADFSNQIVWDENRKCYLLLCREDYGAGGGVGELRGVRIMAHNKDNDLINHPSAWKTLTKFILNDPDRSIVPGSKGTPQRQIHTMPLWYYEGIWFALTDVLVATDVPVPEGKQDFLTRHEQGVWEFYVAPSRDAINFDFEVAAYPRKTLIPRGPDGSFDKDCVRPPSNIITHDDEHWIYYLGTNERWGARKWDARLALAKLRLDGFFYLEAKEEPGTVLTKPFALKGDKVQVNVDAAGGYVKVELLDADGSEIPGFSGDAAKLYRDPDKLRLEPEWYGQADLSSLKGKQVRLRFTLKNAKIYAFQIRQSEHAK